MKKANVYECDYMPLFGIVVPYGELLKINFNFYRLQLFTVFGPCLAHISRTEEIESETKNGKDVHEKPV
jgi:hypothetical protein